MSVILARRRAAGRASASVVLPSFVAAATAVADGPASVTVDKPTGTLEGHAMVAVLADNQARDVTAAPSGWTLIKSGNASVLGVRCYSKVAGPSEPANYQWTLAASSTIAVAILTYADVDISTPVDASDLAQLGGGGTNAINAPAVTTLGPNRMILRVGIDRATTVSTPGGLTQRVHIPAAGGSYGPTVRVLEVGQAVAGSTGTVGFTMTTADSRAAATIALAGAT